MLTESNTDENITPTGFNPMTFAQRRITAFALNSAFIAISKFLGLNSVGKSLQNLDVALMFDTSAFLYWAPNFVTEFQRFRHLAPP